MHRTGSHSAGQPRRFWIGSDADDLSLARGSFLPRHPPGYRSPRFEMAPSLCLPPVDFWSGVSPSQAAKSRPARKLPAAGKCRDCGGSNRTAPGIVISRHATGSALERRLISPSSSLICASSAVKVSISSLRTNRALSGYEEFGSST
jgi:hypothetical protein